jgi:hypothetical protein
VGSRKAVAGGDSWPRNEYAAAVWAAASLRPLEKLTALAFADHAGRQEYAFLTYPRLREVTGIASDATIRAALVRLISAGWLELKEPARGRRAARYWLRIPTPCATAAVAQGDARSTTIRVRSTTVRVRSTTPAVADHQDHQDHHQPSADKDAERLDPRTLVVVDALPDGPRQKLAIQVADRHIRSLADVWTPSALAAAVKHRSWTGAGAGAVINWLKDLPASPAPRIRGADPCQHGVAGGRRVTGRGAHASRVCPDCETADRAVREATA